MKFFGILVCFSLCLLPGSAVAAVGGLDPTFGEGGFATAPLEPSEGGSFGLGVGPDGSAVVGNGEGSLLRFGPQGVPDPVFGSGGRLAISDDLLAEGVAERAFQASNFAVDGAGRLLVFGARTDSRRGYPLPGVSRAFPQQQTAIESEAVVLRFDPEGKLDPNFGAGQGFVRSTFGVHAYLHTDLPLANVLVGRVDSQNRPVFVVGGAAVELGCYAGSLTSFPRAVVRLTEAGAVDPSFGDEGVAPISGSTGGPALAIDAADRPALGLGPYPHARLACRAGTALARLRADGEALGRFGSHGTVALGRNLDLDFVTPAGAMILDHTKGRTLEVVRIGLSGIPDGGFGEGGTAKVRLPVRAGGNLAPVAVDSAGRILLAGFIGRTPYPTLNSKLPKHPSLVVGRLLRDGRLDRSFGAGGWSRDRVPGSLQVAGTTAALDPQGRLLLAASLSAGPSGGGYLLARYLLGG